MGLAAFALTDYSAKRLLAVSIFYLRQVFNLFNRSIIIDYQAIKIVFKYNVIKPKEPGLDPEHILHKIMEKRRNPSNCLPWVSAIRYEPSINLH